MFFASKMSLVTKYIYHICVNDKSLPNPKEISENNDKRFIIPEYFNGGSVIVDTFTINGIMYPVLVIYPSPGGHNHNEITDFISKRKMYGAHLVISDVKLPECSLEKISEEKKKADKEEIIEKIIELTRKLNEIEKKQ